MDRKRRGKDERSPRYAEIPCQRRKSDQDAHCRNELHRLPPRPAFLHRLVIRSGELVIEDASQLVKRWSEGMGGRGEDSEEEEMEWEGKEES